MSKRVMKLILNAKHKALVNSITDKTVQELVEKNSIVTGGAIASMLLKEEINDFDFYFTNFETCVAVANYYVNQFVKEHPDCKVRPEVILTKENIYGEDIKVEEVNGVDSTNETKIPLFEDIKVLKNRVRIRIKSTGVAGDDVSTVTLSEDEENYIEKSNQSPVSILEKADTIDANSIGNLYGHGTEQGKFRPVYLTDNAITLSDKAQLIIRFYGDAEEIHKNYDFVHCTNYWRSDTKELVLKAEALESLLTKQLFYMGSRYPLCSLIRMRKFLKRGFSCDAGQILKMCFQVSKLDLSSIKTLEDQLVGVDQAYFSQMINYLQQEKAKNENWVMELPYLVSLIDKIF